MRSVRLPTPRRIPCRVPAKPGTPNLRRTPRNGAVRDEGKTNKNEIRSKKIRLPTTAYSARAFSPTRHTYHHPVARSDERLSHMNPTCSQPQCATYLVTIIAPPSFRDYFVEHRLFTKTLEQLHQRNHSSIWRPVRFAARMKPCCIGRRRVFPTDCLPCL